MFHIQAGNSRASLTFNCEFRIPPAAVDRSPSDSGVVKVFPSSQSQEIYLHAA